MNVSRGLLQPTKSKALLGFSFRAVKWVPHPKRADTGGEDAFMSHLDAQGVFDGVSWWRNHVGVNSGLYSAALARSLHEVIEEVAAPATMSSLDLLQRAYDRSLAKGIPGTSTALVMTLQCSGGGACTSDGGETTEFSNDVLDICNVGDCRAMIIRDGDVVFVSGEQMHSFDYPFQLGESSTDVPSCAQQYHVKVRPGDLLLLGSDGVFDNLFAQKIAELSWACVGPAWAKFVLARGAVCGGGPAAGSHVSPADDVMKALTIALDEVMQAVRTTACDRGCETPYSNKAIEAGIYFRGGRLDDITLLGSVIDERVDSGGALLSSEGASLLPSPRRD